MYTINKRDMNLNVMFRVLIHVYVNIRGILSHVTHQRGVVLPVIFRLNRARYFCSGKIFNERSIYLACILVITAALITAHTDVT